MAASRSKSKGGGTLLVALLLLLGVAGASAYFIHSILTGEERQTAATTPPGSPAATEERMGSVDVSRPGPDAGDSSGTGGASDAMPSGQFVAPPANAPGSLAGGAPGDGGAPGTSLPGGARDLSSPDGHQPPFAGAEGGEGDVPGADEPARGLLMVPGSMPPPPPSAKEDAVVRPGFIDDIAAFLAQNYWPRHTHPSARRSGITTASLQWANLRYGGDLQGLDGRSDPGTARRAILDYVLNPAAVGKLYGMYADGFVDALRQEADKRVVGEADGKRSLSTQEKKEMFGIYAAYASRIASALEEYAGDAAMPGKVRALSQAETAVQEANRGYMESMLAFEDASASGDKARITAAKLRMDKEAATYQKRIRERESARQALVAAMSKDKKAAGNGDTLVYTAFWAYRRGGDSAPSLRACAKALYDMSAKLTAAARHIQ